MALARDLMCTEVFPLARVTLKPSNVLIYQMTALLLLQLFQWMV